MMSENNSQSGNNLIDCINCLTGILADKEIVAKYELKIATIRHWKNKSINEDDSWRRIAYELMVRYVPKKDKHLHCGEIDLKKNITILEIGEKNYHSFETSHKAYKRFLHEIITQTPTDILKARINFLKECVDSR